MGKSFAAGSFDALFAATSAAEGGIELVRAG
jgi:hypothetical protein